MVFSRKIGAILLCFALILSNGNVADAEWSAWSIGAAVAGGVGAVVGTVVAAPVVLTAVGFTGAGIAAGSVGSAFMSTAAVVNGGGVASMAAGGIVAACQSAAATGVLSYTTMAVVGTAGAAAGKVASGE